MILHPFFCQDYEIILDVLITGYIDTFSQCKTIIEIEVGHILAMHQVDRLS